jgi:ABC-2 type transport system permease protein
MAATALVLGASAANVRMALTLPFGNLLVFAMFYVLGYLLYSSLFAAVGAAFNSIDEAQHWNFLITLPLLISGLMAWTEAGMPPSTLFTVVSFIPPFTPVLMSMRIALGQAPAWQVGLALALMLGSIYVALVVSARIYRVGILMYGKKPTVREIARWLRFA